MAHDFTLPVLFGCCPLLINFDCQSPLLSHCRFVEALRAQLREKIEIKGIQLPPLCCCGDSVWDTNPETCANNCVFYKNPRGKSRRQTDNIHDCQTCSDFCRNLSCESSTWVLSFGRVSLLRYNSSNPNEKSWVPKSM